MPKFKLQSKFKPTGDQPEAIKKLTTGIKKGLKDQVLLGVTGSGKTFTMANVIEKIQKPSLIISHNKTLAAQLAAEFQEFFPDNAVHYFVSYYDYYLPESYTPQTDTYIEKETSINEEIDRLRHAATQALLTRKDVIIVASVSCIFGLGSPEQYQGVALQLTTNPPASPDGSASGGCGKKQLTRKEILKKLLAMRYERNDVDLHRGTFRVRGNILDVFPSFSLDEIYRITFKGDIIDKLEILNSLTLKPLPSPPLGKGRESITIFPATHYVAPFENLENILKQIEKDMMNEVKKFEKQNKLLEAQRLKQRVSFDLEMIRQAGYCNGIENYSRYFDSRQIGEPPYTLLDYFPHLPLAKGENERGLNKNSPLPNPPLIKGRREWLLFIDESHMTIPQIKGMYAGDHSRKQTLIDFGFRLKAAFDNRPLNFEEFEKRMPQTIYVSATPGEYELRKSQITNYKLQTNYKSQLQKKKNKSLVTDYRLPVTGVVEQLLRPTGLLDPKISIKPTKNQINDILKEVNKRIKSKQRVLITTLTKRMSEDLAEYLQEKNIKAYYLHSEINTMERLEILRDLRSGVYDVIVGINLLREGLDLPEVSLVLILDSDKEGFLRSDTSLIQTMGRAARHAEGKVIMYADQITRSMQRAISEVNRRRKIQEEHNKKHNIIPKTIKKEIKSGILGQVRHEASELIEDLPKYLNSLPLEEISHIVKDLENQMNISAQNLEFETAALLRDQIKALQEGLEKKNIEKKSKQDQFAKLKSLKK